MNINELITNFMIESLKDQGLCSVNITEEKDHYGDDSFYIHCTFNLQNNLDKEKFLFLTSKLRKKLLENGVDKFPFLQYHFHPDQQI